MTLEFLNLDDSSKSIETDGPLLHDATINAASGRLNKDRSHEHFDFY